MTRVDATAHSVTGVILAGGLSRRMGGGDKGLADLEGQSMIGRVADRLRPQVARMIVNANGDPARFSTLGLPVVADRIEGFAGPLAGVLAGLEWARTHQPADRYVASVSSDAPFIPTDLVARLAAALGDRPTSIAVARSADGLHPVIALWPTCHAEDLASALHAGVRKVLAWTDRHGTVPVAFEDVVIGGQRIDPFFNANTPDELDRARALLRQEAQ